VWGKDGPDLKGGWGFEVGTGLKTSMVFLASDSEACFLGIAAVRTFLR
jgi:hypothetical protein